MSNEEIKRDLNPFKHEVCVINFEVKWGEAVTFVCVEVASLLWARLTVMFHVE